MEDHMTMPVPDSTTMVQLLAQQPVRRFNCDDIDRFLRDLMGSNPDSMLLTFQHVSMIVTNSHTHAHTLQEGYLALLEIQQHERYAHLLGGPVGDEYFVVTHRLCTTRDLWAREWVACSGTPHQLDRCVVPSPIMIECYSLLHYALEHRPVVKFPGQVSFIEQVFRTECTNLMQGFPLQLKFPLRAA